MISIRSLLPLFLAAGMAIISPEVRAQQIQVTPDPAPVNGTITVKGFGFPPNYPITILWDNQPSSQLALSNVYLNPAPKPDASGSFSFTLSLPVLHAYPATAGPHNLIVAWTDPNTFQLVGVSRTVNLTPRQGWTTNPIPTQPRNSLAPGTLAFLRYNADKTATALVATDGQTERVLGTAPVTNLQFGQPDWSPDGTRLAFSTVLDTFPHHNVYVMNMENGAVSQATNIGGTPPQITGGGVGSITGGILPYLQKLPTTLPDPGEDFCNGIIKGSHNQQTGQTTIGLFPEYPLGGHALLVGTGIVVNATLQGGQQPGKDVPYQFRIDNVPAGEYSVHMYHNMTICTESSRVDLTQEGRIIRSWIRTSGIPDADVRVRVTPGQVTVINPVRTLGGQQMAGTPTFLTDDTIVYQNASRVYEVSDSSTADIWSVRAGQAPVQHSQWITHETLQHPDASPANGLITGVSNSAKGMFISTKDNIQGTADILSNWLAIATATGGSASVSDYYPSWDPTGTYIAFIRVNTKANINIGDVWIQEIATGKEDRLTGFQLQNEGAYGRPVWSPDRSQLAVTYTTDGQKTTNILVLNVPVSAKGANGNRTGFLLTSDGRSALPAWAPARAVNTLPDNVSFLPQPPVVPTFKPGDLNEDSAVTVTDAVMGLQMSVGLIAPTSRHLEVGDFDKDNKITVTDVIRILRIVVGL